jgi:hypothetical protein
MAAGHIFYVIRSSAARAAQLTGLGIKSHVCPAVGAFIIDNRGHFKPPYLINVRKKKDRVFSFADISSMSVIIFD